ncbi:MAG: DNA translocase FtsK 4TM domain-containing protein [Candidatus Kuenenbacteria bacterium]
MRRRKKRKSGFSGDFLEVENSTKKGIFIVVIFVVALISLLSIFDLAGGFGRWMYKVLKLVFGWGFWIFPLVLLAAGYLNLKNTKYFFRTINWIGFLLLVLGYSGFFHLVQDPELYKEILKDGIGGGYVGFAISYPFFAIMGRWASIIVMLAFLVIGVLLMFNTTLETLIEKATMRNLRHGVGSFVNNRIHSRGEEADENENENEGEGGEVEFDRRELAGSEEEEDEEDGDEEEEGDQSDEDRPLKKNKKYPRIDIPLNLLNAEAGEPTARDVNLCREIIQKTLNNFGIEVEMGDYSIGPTVTQYTFRPAEGVKLSRIIGLSNDLSLALAAHPIRIEAPIPGKALVGIEVPNKKIAVVPLRQVLESKEFKTRKSNLSIVLGQDVTGKPWVADLARLPHLLVAGATNSGKTVCLNSIIISLLYQNQPDELKLILVDPKRVEMIGYNDIPYLMTPVIIDIKKTINALKWTISEMERRFHVLSNAGKRNIQSYNITHPRSKMPYLVFIIDELADLMSVASAEVEAAVIRLAQMSRAVGIHLILSTQRPSVDIITGLIKANIPGRIAFSVVSLTDSRTILDVSGAEKLLGRGDMLFTSAEISKPKRLQGAYVTDGDIENVVNYLRKSAKADYDEAVVEKIHGAGISSRTGAAFGFEGEDSDEFLDEARDLVIEAGKASASYLQRRLRVGYARAARILDLLEEEGIIGPADGSKPREILVSSSKEIDDDEIVDDYIEEKVEEDAVDQENGEEEENNDFGEEEDEE